MSILQLWKYQYLAKLKRKRILWWWLWDSLVGPKIINYSFMRPHDYVPDAVFIFANYTRTNYIPSIFRAVNWWVKSYCRFTKINGLIQPPKIYRLNNYYTVITGSMFNFKVFLFYAKLRFYQKNAEKNIEHLFITEKMNQLCINYQFFANSKWNKWTKIPTSSQNKKSGLNLRMLL